MRLITPDSLHYPITVTKLRCKESQDVANNAPLFDYEYRTKVLEGSEDDKDGKLVERTFPSTFQSYTEGSLSQWLIKPGMIIARPRTPIADIEEPCKHEVQFGGMCANCGKDMTTVDYNTVTKDTDRATVNTVHGHTALLVSAAEASKSDEEAKRRLLQSRKLSLVVDLDQTIIHATVDPTVAEWQKDPSNPNHDAVKDVQAFQLIDEGPNARGCWYYIKLRPGLKEFLDTISKYYELHIYTMGTRAYAQNIAKIVDPDRKVFGDRILSRDESGSMTVKNLKRLFPVDTKMVVIIDDRGDVWHWSQNLVKVTPYDFFVGIGDINSSFLPKRPGIDMAPPPTPPKTDASTDGEKQDGEAASSEETSNGGHKKHTRPTSTDAVEPLVDGDISAIEQLMSMGGGNDATKLQEQTTEQDEAIAAQLAERPLLKKQKILDAADETSPTPGSDSQNGTSHHHNLLRDDDTELKYLQQSLVSVHNRFFSAYETQSTPLDSRISALRPGTAKKPLSDLTQLPDVTSIMASMKAKVLRGTSLVFSGVVPLGINIRSHDLAVWATSFGANVTDNITRRTTHVIASPQRRTAKVRQAAKRGSIAIVTTAWLIACFQQWKKLDEAPYKVHTDLSDAPHELSPLAELDDAPLSSSDEEPALTEDEGDTPPPTGTAGDETDTDVDPDELAAHMPSLSKEASSGGEGEEDWAGIDDELAEFLGSDDDEDSAAGSETEAAPKRKRADDESTDGDHDDPDSQLQKRKRKALARTTSLTDGVTTDTDDDGDLEAALAREMALLDSEDDE